MNQVVIVLAVVMATAGLLALWVWVLGRLEAREQQREASATPRHRRGRNHFGRRED